MLSRPAGAGVGDIVLVVAVAADVVAAALIWGPARVSGFIAVVPIVVTLLAGVVNWTRRTAAQARQAALVTTRGERDDRLRALADCLRGIGADASGAGSLPARLDRWEPDVVKAYLAGTELPPWGFVEDLLEDSARRNRWPAEDRAGYERLAREPWGAAFNAVTAAGDAERAARLAVAASRGPRRVLFWVRSRRVFAGAVTVAIAAALLGVWLAGRPVSLPAYGWTVATGGAIESSPCVADGVVYVSSNDHYLYAVNAASGRVLWRVKIGSENGSSPACADGNVYIGSWTTGDILAITATGRVLWSYGTTSPVESSPVVAGGTVYVGSDSTRLYALDARTGHWKWYTHLDGEIIARPAVSNGVVYIGSHGGVVYAVNASNGHILWHRDTSGAIGGSGPAVAGDMVYVGSDDHKMYALDQATGHVLWTYVTGGAVESTPVVADGNVYFGSEDGIIYAVGARSGRPAWTYPTGGHVDSGPVMAHGDVFVGSGDESVYALNAASGALAWSRPTGGPVESGPSAPATTNTVYTGSDDGSLYALNAVSGA